MLLTTLSVLAGVCLYAAIHHLWIARHLLDRTHLLFALLCLVVSCYVLAKTGTYRAATAAELVSLRRWEVSLGIVGIGLLPWFAAAYVGIRPRVLLPALSALTAVFLAANLFLPFGTSFIEFPTLEYFTLPWGEQVVDLRVHHRSIWHNAAWAALLLNFAYAGYACVRQYRHGETASGPSLARGPRLDPIGEQRKALELAFSLGVFLCFVLFNQVVNIGLINFTHTAEFGFIALVLLMSAALSGELRRRAEARAASEARFRSLVEQSPFSIQVLAPDGRTRLVNRAWEQLWGIKVEALANYNVLHDKQLAANGVLPYLERAFQGAAVEIPPIVYNPKDTAEISGGPFRETANAPSVARGPRLGPIGDRWVRAYAYPLRDEAQQVREVILMHEDVTARKRAEDALRHIAAGVSARTGAEFFRDLVTHLAALFDADYALIGLLDEHERRTVTTQAVYAHGVIAPNITYGLDHTPCDNVIGQGTCAYPHGVQQLFPQDRLLAEMGVESFIGTPLFDAHGAPIGLIEVLSGKPLEHIEQVREILEIFAARASAEIQRLRAEREVATYREQLEERVRERTAQLEAANKELEAFTYSVSHDLRAPLRAIDGFSLVLLEDYAGILDNKARGFLMRVRSATQRMGALIDDLLQLSRVTRQEMSRQALNLGALAQEFAAELQASDPERAVEWVLAPEVPVTGDPHLLRIVLDNLLGNAWKYTSKKPQARIEFGVTQYNGKFTFFVRDNGAGFDMSHADKLFGAFQRFHKPEEFPGTGVGLATVARIVHRHGGTIWAQAVVGQGATFCFTL